MNKTELPYYGQLIQEASLQPLGPLPLKLREDWEALVPKKNAPVLDGIRAVLFDLYGTLFISGAGEIAAMAADIVPAEIQNNALAEMETYFRQEVKRRHETARAAGIDWPEVKAEEIWAAYKGNLPDARIASPYSGRELALRYELEINPVYPMPYAKEVLHSLVSGGRKLGIISNAQFYTPLLFNAFFNASPRELGFDPELCIYSFEEGEAKPSPRLFTKARELLIRQNIQPEETLYIGNDMRNDIIPAAAAGFATALFAGDRRSLRLRESDPACAGKKPSMVIKDLRAIAPPLV